MAGNSSSRKKKSNIIMIVCVVVGAIFGSQIARSGFGGNTFGFIAIAVLLLVGIFSIWVIISSAKKTPKADQLADREAKNFSPLADKGKVYIFRDQFIANAKAFAISLSGKDIGYIKGKTFICLELPEGQYILGGEKACKEELTFSVEANQVLFIEQEVITGAFSASYAYRALPDENNARTRIKNCRLLKHKQI